MRVRTLELQTSTAHELESHVSAQAIRQAARRPGKASGPRVRSPFFGTRPVFWKINENLCLVYLWRTFDFPGFRRLSQLLDIAMKEEEEQGSERSALGGS